MDRTAQKKALTDLINPLFNALDLSDAAAAKSGATGSAQSLAIQAYTVADANLRDKKPGSGTAWDKAVADLNALNIEQPVDFQAAVDARAKFNDLWQQMGVAYRNLLQNPGEVENTTGKV